VHSTRSSVNCQYRT